MKGEQLGLRQLSSQLQEELITEVHAALYAEHFNNHVGPYRVVTAEIKELITDALACTHETCIRRVKLLRAVGRLE